MIMKLISIQCMESKPQFLFFQISFWMNQKQIYNIFTNMKLRTRKIKTPIQKTFGGFFGHLCSKKLLIEWILIQGFFFQVFKPISFSVPEKYECWKMKKRMRKNRILKELGGGKSGAVRHDASHSNLSWVKPDLLNSKLIILSYFRRIKVFFDQGGEETRAKKKKWN